MPSGPFRRTTGHRPGNARHAREDKDILESTDPDALVDLRRRGVEYSMDSDRPGILIRRKLMELLTRHGELEVHR